MMRSSEDCCNPFIVCCSSAAEEWNIHYLEKHSQKQRKCALSSHPSHLSRSLVEQNKQGDYDDLKLFLLSFFSPATSTCSRVIVKKIYESHVNPGNKDLSFLISRRRLKVCWEFREIRLHADSTSWFSSLLNSRVCIYVIWLNQSLIECENDIHRALTVSSHSSSAGIFRIFHRCYHRIIDISFFISLSIRIVDNSIGESLICEFSLACDFFPFFSL